jgi:hypothetical protein
MCPVDVQDGLRLPNFRRDSLEDFVGFSDRMSVGFTSKVVLIAMAMNKAYDELDPASPRFSVYSRSHSTVSLKRCTRQRDRTRCFSWRKSLCEIVQRRMKFVTHA